MTTSYKRSTHFLESMTYWRNWQGPKSSVSWTQTVASGRYLLQRSHSCSPHSSHPLEGTASISYVPFGISSAPEHFQKRMSQILSGLEGVMCLMDDVPVFSSTQEQHEQRLKEVLHHNQGSRGHPKPQQV